MSFALPYYGNRKNRRREKIMKVLVVDDNQFLASTIQAVLEFEGCEVMAAEDGMDGYATYLLFEPDLVITDIQMPRKNGLEMMELIRTHNPMIKTVYMSGDISAYETALAAEEKKYPVRVFGKPFSLDVLKRFIGEPAPRPLPGNLACSY